MPTLAERLWGTHSERELKKIYPIADKIDGMRSRMKSLTDEELSSLTKVFRQRLSDGETLDDILPEAFAAMREADRRTLGMEPFYVQLIGGIVLHEGRVAEMLTGSGKTLTATLPAYLNALTGKNVMVVTVNDYLAARDASDLRPAYEFMGLTVSDAVHEKQGPERKAAYACDVTYVTNSELGFDYLRDNMAKKKEDQVLRGLDYCIIDEADSILIDEARTPLIISGQGDEEISILHYADKFAKSLDNGGVMEEHTKLDAIALEMGEEKGDFMYNMKDKSISLTETGARKADRVFGVENISDPEYADLRHYIQNALRANYLMKKDQDYIVKDGEVLIVDEFTGRVLPGRRFSDGMHQAIEAKEGVKVNDENKTLASITYQCFFNLFVKKAGMTGTGITAEKEFRDVYSLDVIHIPPNKPVIRVDMDDEVYKTKEEKNREILREVMESYLTGQPVLVGTKTVRDSEELSEMMRANGVRNTVLNAKQDKEEADTIAKAGEFRAVTIATNMAGRGTDIKLSEEAKKAGGLYVIGTERSESRRIDDQLIGRSGRQGDPGKSKFIISLEDDLLSLFSSKRTLEKIAGIATEEDIPIHHPLLTKAIVNAQSNMEATHAAERSNILKYDEVVNEQRQSIYAEREIALQKTDCQKHIVDMIRLGSEVIFNATSHDEYSLKKAFSFLPYPLDLPDKLFMKEKDLLFKIQGDVFVQYIKAASVFDPSAVRKMECWALLEAVDKNWSNYLDAIEYLKQNVRLQNYAHRDPVVEFKMQSGEIFDKMLDMIRVTCIMNVFHVLSVWREEKRARKEKHGKSQVSMVKTDQNGVTTRVTYDTVSL